MYKINAEYPMDKIKKIYNDFVKSRDALHSIDAQLIIKEKELLVAKEERDINKFQIIMEDITDLDNRYTSAHSKYRKLREDFLNAIEGVFVESSGINGDN